MGNAAAADVKWEKVSLSFLSFFFGETVYAMVKEQACGPVCRPS
jgi:hypothetical protein